MIYEISMRVIVIYELLVRVIMIYELFEVPFTNKIKNKGGDTFVVCSDQGTQHRQGLCHVQYLRHTAKARVLPCASSVKHTTKKLTPSTLLSGYFSLPWASAGTRQSFVVWPTKGPWQRTSLWQPSFLMCPLPWAAHGKSLSHPLKVLCHVHQTHGKEPESRSEYIKEYTCIHNQL